VVFRQMSFWVKGCRPIQPLAPPDVAYTSKIGHGFAALRHVALGPGCVERVGISAIVSATSVSRPI